MVVHKVNVMVNESKVKKGESATLSNKLKSDPGVSTLEAHNDDDDDDDFASTLAMLDHNTQKVQKQANISNDEHCISASNSPQRTPEKANWKVTTRPKSYEKTPSKVKLDLVVNPVRRTSPRKHLSKSKELSPKKVDFICICRRRTRGKFI